MWDPCSFGVCACVCVTVLSIWMCIFTFCIIFFWLLVITKQNRTEQPPPLCYGFGCHSPYFQDPRSRTLVDGGLGYSHCWDTFPPGDPDMTSLPSKKPATLHVGDLKDDTIQLSGPVCVLHVYLGDRIHSPHIAFASEWTLIFRSPVGVLSLCWGLKLPYWAVCLSLN